MRARAHAQDKRRGSHVRLTSPWCALLLRTVGTLADQITYPTVIKKEDRTDAINAELTKVLALVGIGYLVARWGSDGLDALRDADATREFGLKQQEGAADLTITTEGFDRVVRWEDVLSLGEQQRLGMARMFYHSPKFAVLDECTSAVSIDVEEKLYETAFKKGITCITISQKMTLPKFHTQELRFGEDTPEGWVLEDIAEGLENIVASGGFGGGLHDDAHTTA
eukprot:SAG11_NODE_163_length_13928_cov_29.869188_9_plen_224_part_00